MVGSSWFGYLSMYDYFLKEGKKEKVLLRQAVLCGDYDVWAVSGIHRGGTPYS